MNCDEFVGIAPLEAKRQRDERDASFLVSLRE
jgi:hypothetical protein